MLVGRRAFKPPPPPTTEVGGGLPSLPNPRVASSRARWLRALGRLRSLPGVDLALLAEVESWVRVGVKTAFPRGPPKVRRRKNTSAFIKNRAVCLERMAVYEDMRALRKLAGVPPPGAHVQPLHAVVKEGKKARVCVDLSFNFNDYVEDFPFKMASVQDGVDLALQARSQTGRPAWFAKLDVSSCFLSFPIHEDDRHFFYCEAAGDFFQFVSLVFGRKDAPRVVSMLLDVVSAEMTDAGVAHVRYLDDFLIVATTATRAWACTHLAASMLVEFGLALSLPKVEGPLQRLEFLGIVVDSTLQTLEISEGRQEELLGLLRAASTRRRSSARRLQSLLGKLSFASVVLPGARPFLRRVIDMVSLAVKVRGQVQLTAAFRAEVRYWRDHIARWNGRCGWRAPSAVPVVFASDASTSGFAFGLESCPPGLERTLPPRFEVGAVRAGVWSAANGDAGRQASSSAIQWGEFFCPLAAVVEYGALLEGQHLVFVVDNNSDVAVINRQRTREPRVALLLRALCDASLEHNFTYAAVHRAGVENVLMDWASRPEYHRFAAAAPKLTWPRGVDGGGLGGAYPPLRVPVSLTYINSRCLRFGSKGNSATFAPSSSGWLT